MTPTTLAILRSRQPPTLCLADHERHLIACALLETFGNISEAANLMGISRRTMHRAILRWPDLVPPPLNEDQRELRTLRRRYAKLTAEQRAVVAAL